MFVGRELIRMSTDSLYSQQEDSIIEKSVSATNTTIQKTCVDSAITNF